MNIKRTLSSLFLTLAFSVSCSSAPKARIVETDSGALQAVGSAKNEPDARGSAMDGAMSYCSKQNETAVFREHELHKKDRLSKYDLDLSKIPVIGRVLRSDDKTEVILGFRCSRRQSNDVG
jgi:hypothetical protein